MKPSPVVLDEPEEGSRVRVSAVLGGVLVVVVVGVLAWLATGTPAAPDRTPGLRQTVRLRDVWATTPPPPPVAAEAVAAAASAPADVPPGWLDVCGIGLVKESEWMGQASIEARAASMAAARRQAVAAFKARGDEVSHAVALALEAYGGDVELDEALACEGEGCPAIPTRIESPQARKRRFASHVATRDQLVQLALGSRNPEVYALAYNVCEMQGGDDAGSSCHMLSADQWARLDPGNGVPWLAVAERAKARGDRAGVAEALYRVGLATSMNARVGSLSQRLIEQGAGQGAGPRAPRRRSRRSNSPRRPSSSTCRGCPGTACCRANVRPLPCATPTGCSSAPRSPTRCGREAPPCSTGTSRSRSARAWAGRPSASRPRATNATRSCMPPPRPSTANSRSAARASGATAST